VGIALLQIPVTRLLTRYRRTRAAALGGGVFCVAFLSFAALGLISARTPVLIGVFAATLLFTLGELLHGATASALVASTAPEATRGRHLAVYQLSWAIPTALAPAVLTGLLQLSPTGMWLLLAAGVAGSALALVRLEPKLPAQAVRAEAAAEPTVVKEEAGPRAPQS
jgi:MFS family permease